MHADWLYYSIRGDGRHGLRYDVAGRRGTEGYVVPGAVVEGRQIPSGLLQAEVVMFAGVNAVEYNFAGGGLPVLACADNGGAAIGKGYTKIQAKGGAVAPGRFVEEPHCGGLVVIPAVAEDNADGVRAGLEIARNVVGHVERAAVEPGVHGIEQMVADLMAVDMQFIKSAGSDVGACGGDGFGIVECLSEQRGWFIGNGMMVGDPVALPVVAVHHTGFKSGGGTVYFPLVFGKWLQGGAVVGDGIVSGGGIPQQLTAAVDLDMRVCGHAGILPGEARVRVIDAQWMNEIVAPQAGGRLPGCREAAAEECEEGKIFHAGITECFPGR